jgi:hypothetical protein
VSGFDMPSNKNEPDFVVGPISSSATECTLTNPMQQSVYSQADSGSVSQEVTHLSHK